MKTLIPLSRLWKLSLVLFAAFTVVSCQKQINPLDEDGTAPGEEVVVPASDSYLPITKDSYWLLQDSTDESLIYRFVATGEKKQFSDINYDLVLSTDGAGTEDPHYFARKGDEYYMLLDMEEFGGTGTFNMLYLIDKKNAGFEWTKSTGTFNGIPGTIKGRIMAKASSVTWKGKTYSDVVHTKVDLVSTMFGLEVVLTTYEFYSAKGIGFVKLHNSIASNGQIFWENKVFLTEYLLK